MRGPRLHFERLLHIGASESASLFSLDLMERGEKVYETRFELWHRKAGLLPHDSEEENARLFWGQKLEAGIALGLRDLYGWKIRKVRRYISHPRVPGMGASLDYEVLDHVLGPGVVEIKNVDADIYRDWPEVEGIDDPGLCAAVGVPCLPRRREPPLRLQLQVQHQLAVTSRAWGVLAILVGGNKLIPIPYPRVESTIARIEEEVPRFWESVRLGVRPPVDWTADVETVTRLYGDADALRTVNLRGDAEARTFARRYLKAARLRDRVEEIREQMKARLLVKIGGARRATLDDGMTITAAVVAGSGNRKPYRGFQLRERRR